MLLLMAGASLLLLVTFGLSFTLPVDSRLGRVCNALSMASALVVLASLVPHAASAVPVVVVVLISIALAALVTYPIRARIRPRP